MKEGGRTQASKASEEEEEEGRGLPSSLGLDAVLESILGSEIDRPPICCPKNDPLPGAVVSRYRTVDGKTYGPYWSRVWRDEHGRQRSAYVKPEDLEATRLACQAHRDARKAKGRAQRRSFSSWTRSLGSAMETLEHAQEARIRLEHGQPPERAAHPRVRTLMELLGGAE